MSIHVKNSAVVIVLLTLIAACGQAEPSTTPIPPTVTPAPSSLTPTQTLLLPTDAPGSEAPSLTGLAPLEGAYGCVSGIVHSMT